jgi:hypothetical protein
MPQLSKLEGIREFDRVPRLRRFGSAVRFRRRYQARPLPLSPPQPASVGRTLKTRLSGDRSAVAPDAKCTYEFPDPLEPARPWLDSRNGPDFHTTDDDPLSSAGRPARPAERLAAVDRRGRAGPRLHDAIGRERKGSAGHQGHRIVAVHRLVVSGEIFGTQGANQRIVRHGRSPFVLREASGGAGRPRLWQAILRDLCELAAGDLSHSRAKSRKVRRHTACSDCCAGFPRKVKALPVARPLPQEESKRVSGRTFCAGRKVTRTGRGPTGMRQILRPCRTAFGQRR